MKSKKTSVTDIKPVTQKVTSNQPKPLTAEKKKVSHKKVQTAEGWKRSMQKLRKS